MFDLAVREYDGLLHRQHLTIRGTRAFAEKQARKMAKAFGVEVTVVPIG